MKLRLLLLIFLGFSFGNVLLAEPPSYVQTSDGVIVFTDPLFTRTSKAVNLEVVSDHITRVIAAPAKEIVAAQSLVTIYSNSSDLSWNVVSSKEALTLKTKKLTAVIDLKTGAVNFCDHSGKKILEATKTITVDDRKGSFDGMLLKRIFRINIISSRQAKTLDFDAKCDKEIFYNGKKIEIKI